ncbi:MAG: AAA family ATPase [Saprospiraceae bacterium]|nr:AAA family ATPase [Saprospiraceae bacterium]
MKLKSLRIKDFRGLKGDANYIDFTNSDIIFLIGQNNVGKSSFLRAYEFFVDPSQKAKLEDFFDHNPNNKIEIIGEFLTESGDDSDTDLRGSGRSLEPDWIDKWVDPSTGIIKVKKVWSTVDSKFEKFTFKPSEDWVLGGFGGMDTLFTKYAPKPISIHAMETEASLEEKVNKLLADDFLKKLKDIHPTHYDNAVQAISALQQELFGSAQISQLNTNLNAIFKQIFSTLTLEIKPKAQDTIALTEAIKKSHSVHVKKDGITRNETFAQHGHGVIRQALFNFLTFLKVSNISENIRKEYLILFEEPELFLHPKVSQNLRKSLYDLSQNSPYQILCASHSPAMIDISQKHASIVRITKDVSENTRTFQVGDLIFQRDDNKQRVQMFIRFNPHICECFYADEVILVEGDTETIVFRTLLNEYYPQKEIFVLNTGSKTNIQFFQEVLTHFKIKHYVIHDTDTPDKVASWTINQNIWSKIEDANAIEANLARRYVFITDFENANDYQYSKTDGKPLSAYKLAMKIKTENLDLVCLQYLRDIVGDNTINHNQEFVISSVPETTPS